jgi:large subunit ribosomal protein L24
MKKIKSWDKVQVIAGKFNWTVSEVESVWETSVVVKWVNKVKKAVKWQWFVEKTLPIHISNVMFYCEKCKKPVRVSVLKKDDWKKVRACKKCWAEYR